MWTVRGVWPWKVSQITLDAITGHCIMQRLLFFFKRQALLAQGNDAAKACCIKPANQAKE
jgi:hypothetical protein